MQIKEAYRQETEISNKIAQLDHADEIIRNQLELIEQKIAGLEQMRVSLLGKMERHEQTRQSLQQEKET